MSQSHHCMTYMCIYMLHHTLQQLLCVSIKNRTFPSEWCKPSLSSALLPAPSLFYYPNTRFLHKPSESFRNLDSLLQWTSYHPLSLLFTAQEQTNPFPTCCYICLVSRQCPTVLAQAGLALNSRSSCLSFLSAGVANVHQQPRLFLSI